MLTGPDGAAKDETRAMAAWALDEILKLLHPFMPFITEELGFSSPITRRERPASAISPRKGERTRCSFSANGPSLEGLDDPDAEAEIGWLIDLVTAIRSMRAEMNISAQIPVVLAGASAERAAPAPNAGPSSPSGWRASPTFHLRMQPPQGSVQLLVRGEVAALPLKGVIDFAAERVRLQKEMQKAEADIKRVDAKLGNPKFVANAPEEVVEEEREKRAEADDRRAKIVEALERLKGAA